jgi:hypothetical protein
MEENRITVQIPATIVSDTLEGDTIVIDIISGAYYTLTSAAGEVWRQVKENGSVTRDMSLGHKNCLSQLVAEGLLISDSVAMVDIDSLDPAFTKYVDMQDLLLADPVHEVDEAGWPIISK